MKITDLLDPRSISLDAAPTSKSETLDKAVELMAASGKLSDVEAFRKQVYAREEESTTGIGEGIAIPHGKCDAVKKPGLAAMVIKNGVDFDSLDGEPVTLLFLIAAPNTKDNVHLDVLSKLSVLMMDENFSDSLRNASSVEDFLSIIDKADAEQAGIDERLAADSGEEAADTNGENAAQAGGQEIQAQKAGAETEKTAGPKILAVTSCPTGIAHTYMAAEGLEKAARAKGWKIKVETRGSAGAKNVLTAQEIEAADCIIVAADAQVPMDRFEQGTGAFGARGVRGGTGLPRNIIWKQQPGKGSLWRQIGQCRTPDLHAADEWCLPHASVCSRRRHPDCDCVSD